MRVSLPVLNDDRGGLSPAPGRRTALSLLERPASIEVREALGRVLDGLVGYEAGGVPAVLSLRSMPAAVAEGVVGALGDGEIVVSVRGGSACVIRETALAGVWRVDGETLEVSDVPAVVRAEAARATQAELVPAEPPAGIADVLPLLADLRRRALAWAPGQPNHVVSLALPPVSEVDLDHLEEQLGRGSVVAEATGHGQYRVTLTAHRHIWRVEHWNGLGAILLDTVEVGDVPTALAAAKEDIADSAERLRALLDDP